MNSIYFVPTYSPYTSSGRGSITFFLSFAFSSFICKINERILAVNFCSCLCFYDHFTSQKVPPLGSVVSALIPALPICYQVCVLQY